MSDHDELTEALYGDSDLGPGYMYREDCEHLASRVLAFDWLEAHDERIRRETLREAELAVMADISSWPYWVGEESHGRPQCDLSLEEARISLIQHMRFVVLGEEPIRHSRVRHKGDNDEMDS